MGKNATVTPEETAEVEAAEVETPEVENTTETTETAEVEETDSDEIVINPRSLTRGRSKNPDSFYLEGIYNEADFRSTNTLLRNMVRKSNIDPEIVEIMRHQLVPRTHPNYLPMNAAIEKVMPDVSESQYPTIRQRYVNACRVFTQDLLFGDLHEVWRAEREAQGLPASGPFRPRRDKASIEHDKARAEYARTVRSRFGGDVKAKGRLPKKYVDQFDRAMAEWDAKHPAPVPADDND